MKNIIFLLICMHYHHEFTGALSGDYHIIPAEYAICD